MVSAKGTMQPDKQASRRGLAGLDLTRARFPAPGTGGWSQVKVGGACPHCCGIRPDMHWRGAAWIPVPDFLGHAFITNTVRYTAMSPEPFKDIWR